MLAALALMAGPARLPAQTGTYEQLQAFSGVLNHVRLNYVDSVDSGRLIQAAIRGLLGSLDPHSYYVTRREFEMRHQWEEGVLAGPGLRLDDAGRAITVLDVIRNGPAARAGIQPGDRLVRVNDTLVAGLGARTVELRLLGDKDTRLKLTLERGNVLDPDTFAVSLKRGPLSAQVVSIPRMVDSRTGYVRLAEFTPLAPKQLAEAIEKLEGSGAKQLVLDLRGNPGGDVATMVSTASLFLPAGTEVFRTEGRKKLSFDRVTTQVNGKYAALPLVVLIDAGSASAAEMLAGCLQDQDRAVILGRRSFGKALMQVALPLTNGDVVWLTTARVVTPSGRVVQRRYTGDAAPYFESAGRAGAEQDTATVYRTARGRPVRGGGGILPDIVRPIVDLPVWFSVAADSGFILATADSVATLLDSGSRDTWPADTAAWQARLVTPFLERVHRSLGVRVPADSELRLTLAQILANRTAMVRWGPEAAEEFLVKNDGDIRAAQSAFADSPRLLSHAAGP